MACAPSKASDQPGHPPSLIRVFAVCMKKAWVLSYPLSGQWRLIRLGACPSWSESLLDAQSFCWFCHEVAQMVWCLDILISYSTVHVSHFFFSAYRMGISASLARARFSAIFTCSGYFCLVPGSVRQSCAWRQDVIDRSRTEHFLIKNVLISVKNWYKDAYPSLNTIVERWVCKKKNLWWLWGVNWKFCHSG